MLKIGLLGVLLVVTFAPAAKATVIDFEDRTDGPQGVAALFYPEASFTSSTGNVYIKGAGVSKDFCAYDGSCAGVLTVDFTSPVNNLTLDSAGEEASGLLSFADVWVGGVFSTTVPISYDGVFSTYDFVDLRAFSNVTRVVLSSRDAAGVTWDNFSFEAGTSEVPEPSTLLMLGAGLVGFANRRRRGSARRA